MKIMIINPDYGVTKEEIDVRLRILRRHVSADTELAMVCPQNLNVEINSALDVVFAGAEIVDLAVKAQNSGFDAVVLYCFSDPVIDACREALDIPVIGGAQASCLAALNICRNFSVILADDVRLPEKKLFLGTLGVDATRINDIKAVDLKGISIWQDRDAALQRLVACGQKMLEQSHTEAIVLGCLSFLGLAEPLSQMLGVPVIDPAACAVATAESIVRQKLFTSKVSYPMLSTYAKENLGLKSC